MLDRFPFSLPSLMGVHSTFLYKLLIFNGNLGLHSVKVRRRIKIFFLVLQ